MYKIIRTIRILFSLTVICTVVCACADENVSDLSSSQQELNAAVTQEESAAVVINQDTELVTSQQEPETVLVEAEDVDTKLEELKILCIGNSHTEDFTYYLPEMLVDLFPLIHTKIQFTTAPMMGGRHLCYYMDEGEEYDPECYLKIWKDPDHPEYEVYKTLFEQGWDLIIIQDWHESTNTPEWIYPGGASFAEVLGETVSLLRHMAPGAEIAWFADWVDSENEEERKIFYQNSVDAMQAVMTLPEETAPDYILPASTVLANARTSYLGKTKNP